jgi:hypothetical protein
LRAPAKQLAEKGIALVGSVSVSSSIFDWSLGADIPASTELRRRRQQLGATVPMMAVGLGLAPDAINDIENGAASDEMRERYVKWLSILEGWPADKLRIELFLAIQGHRFRP